MPITRHVICPHCGKVARESEVILPSDRRAQKLGYRDIVSLIIDYRASGMAYREISEATGIPERTLVTHAPEDARGFRAKTKLHKERCKNNGKKAVAARMKKWFDYPRADGKSLKKVSIENMVKAEERIFEKCTTRLKNLNAKQTS